jgi:mono/diheme cytochrome c family protein
MVKYCTWLIALSVFMVGGQAAAVDFATEVWPIFEAHCIECHGAERTKGELRLDTQELILKGGESGPGIVAGKPEESKLYQLVTLPPDDVDIMPAKGDPLTPDQTAIIHAWITEGAPFGAWLEAAVPAEEPAGAPAEAAEVATPGVSIEALAEGLAPAPEEALAAVRDKGAVLLPLSQDMPLLDANFQLKGAEITDEALTLLAPLAGHVTRLNLAGTAITDAGLAQLAGLTKLTKLHLEKTAITDAGLVHLKGLTNLEYLNLYGTQVTDGGLQELAALPHLKKLYLWQTGVSKEAAAAFVAAHPGVLVDTGWEAPPEDPAAKLAAFHDAGSCCATAHAEGKACEHECCVAATAAGKICEKCNPTGAAKLALVAKFDAESCCATAQAAGKDCDHPCCVEAAGKGEVCLKCNPGAAEEAAPPAEAAPEPVPEVAPAENAAEVTPAMEKTIGFNRDIRQLLSNNCFQCHGPDKGHRKANLRLDIREVAVASRGDMTPIVPGDSAASEVVRRIMTDDPADMMPPPESEKRLTPEQKELIARWIDEGAEYEPHWSYIEPERPAPPPVQQSEPIKNDIDKFVVTRLETEGLAPAAEAERATLIRRLSFDLRGLPPTPQEVEAFVNDGQPDAYERLVDQFLATPQYGERMAVHWLDLVRYADTNGFHGDEYRSIWPYRDYVVKAFNENKPFDQFTIEQLGGDLLPNPTTEQQVAAAFNRLNQLTAEGGAQPKEYTAKYMADRVRTTATVWMGATMGCAECHDHKFDPYTAKDFYAMGAFFADIEEQAVYGAGEKWDPIMYLPTPEQQAQQQRYEETLAELRREITGPREDLAIAQAEWEREARIALEAGHDGWTEQSPIALAAKNGTTLRALDDASVLSEGEQPAQEVYTVTLPAASETITGLRLEALMHDSLPNEGLSRSNGNFVLSSIAIDLKAAGETKRVPIASAVADYEQPSFGIAATIDDDPKSGWAVNGHAEKGKEHAAVFVFETPVEGGADCALEVRLRFESDHAQHAIGRFRLSTSNQPKPGLNGAWALDDSLKQLLLTDAAARTPEQQAQLDTHYRSIAPILDPVRKDIALIEAKQQQLREEMPYTMATRSITPRETRVLPRGSFLDETGEVVQPAVPEFMPAIQVESERATRLDLAKWLVAKENPLTARVFVNRLWDMYLGAGLSKVLDDLGSQGEWPSHPELLDWLAVEFVESGWDVKHMVRLIVTSNTYRQSSGVSPEVKEIDPNNRLLARQSRYRLDAEFVRDNALAISGLLSQKMFGPPVKPYQPEGYWDNCNTFRGPLVYDTSQGEDQYRRGLYTYWKRSFLHPSLLAFDAPTREECTAERTNSNTPLQALVLLNDPSYVEAARLFAARILREGGDTPETRLDFAYRCALARPPAEQEKAVLLDLVAKHGAEYANNPEAAAVLLSTGQQPMPEDLDAKELAAWTSVARAILNLHETITRS